MANFEITTVETPFCENADCKQTRDIPGNGVSLKIDNVIYCKFCALKELTRLVKNAEKCIVRLKDAISAIPEKGQLKLFD